VLKGTIMQADRRPTRTEHACRSLLSALPEPQQAVLHAIAATMNTTAVRLIASWIADGLDAYVTMFPAGAYAARSPQLHGHHT
jgi:hypothetical protein